MTATVGPAGKQSSIIGRTEDGKPVYIERAYLLYLLQSIPAQLEALRAEILALGGLIVDGGGP